MGADQILLDRVTELKCELDRCKRELRVAQQTSDAMLRPWFNVVRRMQAAARPVSTTRDGYAIIKVTVLCNELGEPEHWLEPEVKRVEPSGRQAGVIALLLNNS